MSFFNANLVMNSDKRQYIKENSLILMRLETIKALTPDNLLESSKSYFEKLKLCMIGKQMVLHQPETMEQINWATSRPNSTICSHKIKKALLSISENKAQIIFVSIQVSNKISKARNVMSYLAISLIFSTYPIFLCTYHLSSKQMVLYQQRI